MGLYHGVNAASHSAQWAADELIKIDYRQIWRATSPPECCSIRSMLCSADQMSVGEVADDVNSFTLFTQLLHSEAHVAAQNKS